MIGRLLLALFAGAALAAAPGEIRAAERTNAEIEEPAPPTVIREWVGIEVTPVSYSLAHATSEQGEASSPLQAGPGGSVRLFRHRWEQVYVIPIQAGIYVGSSNEVIFAHVQTEAGLVVAGTNRRLEVGLGLGLAVLAIKYGNHCDGYCYSGGAGAIVSPVVRYLFHTTPNATMGASVRALIPLEEPSSQLFGSLSSWGSAVLAGIELNFGHQ